jgi:hypothetical protein
MVKQIVGVIVLGACLSIGCAGVSNDTVVDSEGELAAFEHHSLATITADGLIEAYGRQIATELKAAKTKNPDVQQVSKAGVVAFAHNPDFWRAVLRRSLDWYFETSGKDSIAVADIQETLTSAVRPEVEASVKDGAVNLEKLKSPVTSGADDARFEAALGAAKAPAGVNMRDTFEGARAEWGDEAIFLPQSVSRKPTPKQIGEMFDLDLGSEDLGGTGPLALDSINDYLDPVILKDLVAKPASIKDAWLFHVSPGGSEGIFLFVLDEHKQVWGFGYTIQVDE